jgi:hypothetical protein
MNPEVRASADRMNAHGLLLARQYCAEMVKGGATRPFPPIVVSFRFSRLSAYLGTRLEHLLGAQLGRVRAELVERVAPMSLFVGIVRVGIVFETIIRPQIEILYDTTDNTRTNRAFAHLLLDANAKKYVERLSTTFPLGRFIDACSY